MGAAFPLVGMLFQIKNLKLLCVIVPSNSESSDLLLLRHDVIVAFVLSINRSHRRVLWSPQQLLYVTDSIRFDCKINQELVVQGPYGQSMCSVCDSNLRPN